MSPTLRDLLARGTPVEWFEAVAIVQALCKRLLDEAPATGVRVPDLHEIVLTADGTIDLTGEGPAGQSPVFRIGRVLTALVANQQMPVPLRLLALTAVAPSPPYESVQDLTMALDYYERPDRAAILRAVYERNQQLPAIAEAAAPFQEIPAAPAPPPAVPSPSWWKRHPLVVATCLALVLIVAVGGFWPVIRSKAPWLAGSSRQVARLVGATTDTVARTVSSGIEALRERLAGSSSADARPAAPPPAPSPTPSLARPRRALLRATGGWLRPGEKTAYVLPAAPTVAFDWTMEPALMVEPPPLPAPVVEAGEWTIYSAEDLDVGPPVSVHPKLPSEPPPGVRLETLPLLELVISAAGDVETVRLKTLSPDIRTSMMLSAVKAWRFQPATLNGRPVRYRYLVRLTSR